MKSSMTPSAFSAIAALLLTATSATPLPEPQTYATNDCYGTCAPGPGSPGGGTGGPETGLLPLPRYPANQLQCVYAENYAMPRAEADERIQTLMTGETPTIKRYLYKAGKCRPFSDTLVPGKNGRISVCVEDGETDSKKLEREWTGQEVGEMAQGLLDVCTDMGTGLVGGKKNLDKEWSNFFIFLDTTLTPA
ncbi:MAG: hypothetical protein M1831_005194 [Alyxoria varia]|nr:MAG: hypothetical protein M1831_005194 [Alyxoria varia]